MTILVFLSVLLFVFYLQIGVYVLFSNYKSSVNRYFFGLSLCFSVWSFFYIYVYLAPTAERALYWDTWASIGYALFHALMIGFTSNLTNFPSSKFLKNFLFGIFLAMGAFFVYSTFSGNWQVASIVRGNLTWQFYHTPTEIHYILFYIYTFAAASFVFLALLNWRKRIKQKRELYQYRFVITSFILFIVPALYFDVILPAIGTRHLPSIGHLTSAFWIAGVAVGIIKFQFLGDAKYLIAEQTINKIKNIMFFINLQYHIDRTNTYTSRLLRITESEIAGMLIFDFFDNKRLLEEFMNKAQMRTHFGPANLTLIGKTGIQIDANLYFLTIRNNFDDVLGFILYGHDNREALNLIREISVRQAAEKNLRALGETLESRVNERTIELENSYKEFQIIMTERMRVEEQIKSDIAEKEILINEIHSRVKSNMNMIIAIINTQINKTLSATARAKFSELSFRVKSLLLVHQNLYLSINYSHVDFANFIKTLANELLRFYDREEIVELRIEASEVFLDIASAIPLGIAVSELVSNSLKHGFSSQYIAKAKEGNHILHIRYSTHQHNYFVSVSDNGKGLSKNFSFENLNTTGLPLVELLVKEQINGDINFNNNGKYTTFEITFNASN